MEEVASVATKSPGSSHQHKQPEVWQKYLRVLAAAGGCNDGCHFYTDLPPLLSQHRRWFCRGDWKSRAHTWQEVRAGRNSLADVCKSDVCNDKERLSLYLA